MGDENWSSKAPRVKNFLLKTVILGLLPEASAPDLSEIFLTVAELMTESPTFNNNGGSESLQMMIRNMQLNRQEASFMAMLCKHLILSKE